MKYLLASYLFLIAFLTQGQSIQYNLSMPEPHTHYFHVEVQIDDLSKADFIDLKMPVWTPGSYLVREFARNVEGVQASDKSKKQLSVSKISKNTWRIRINNAPSVRFSYQVYAYEHSVRTSFLDSSHGYINAASVFVYLDKKKNLPVTLNITPYASWKTVTTSLPQKGKSTWVRTAPNYDILVDSPIEIGNQKILNFKAANVPHTLCVYGAPPIEDKKLVSDIQKIVEKTTEIFGDNPCQSYQFIAHFVNKGGGGLEHLESTSLIFPRLRLLSEDGYRSWLGLVAHEYFHLWNVKRIYPKALASFDYDTENYTKGLWIAEGFTSYYDDLLLLRSGLVAQKKYLSIAAKNIQNIENTPGNFVQSVADSSFDAWIKFYRRNENSRNSIISYYTKGAVLAMLLDLTIIHETKGNKNLDDLMQLLYQRFFKDNKDGYSEIQFQKAVEEVAGVSLDAFFKNYVNGTKAIDYNRFFGYAGVMLEQETDTKHGFLGIDAREKNGRLTVTYVRRGSAAYNYGVNVNDELVALNSYRLSKGVLEQMKATFSEGQKISLTVARDGKIQDLSITLKGNSTKNMTLKMIENPTPEQKKVFDKWLSK